jgi:hypothetical protein
MVLKPRDAELGDKWLLTFAGLKFDGVHEVVGRMRSYLHNSANRKLMGCKSNNLKAFGCFVRYFTAVYQIQRIYSAGYMRK